MCVRVSTPIFIESNSLQIGLSYFFSSHGVVATS